MYLRSFRNSLFLNVSSIHSSFSVHLNVYLLTPQPPKEAKSWNLWDTCIHTRARAHTHLSESKVLQYFDNVRHNSAASDAFTIVVKIMNHIGRWDAELTWHFPNTTHWICHLGCGFELHAFRFSWLCLFDEVLDTRVKFLESSDYYTVANCTFSFCTTIFLVVSVALWPDSNSIKHKFPN